MKLGKSIPARGSTNKFHIITLETQHEHWERKLLTKVKTKGNEEHLYSDVDSRVDVITSTID